MSKRSFGRLVKHDPRDAAFPLRAAIPKRSLRRQRYWNDTRWFGDQLKSPQCVGYAWAHWLEDGPTMHTGGRPPVVKPGKIYRDAQRLDEFPGEDYEGTTVRGGAKALKQAGYISAYYWARRIEEIITAILEVGPVVVGTEWFEGMSEPDASGLIVPTGYSQGGHAYLLNGVNLDTELFRIKQSWGRGWGRGGRASISFADFASIFTADAEACLATEVRS